MRIPSVTPKGSKRGRAISTKRILDCGIIFVAAAPLVSAYGLTAGICIAVILYAWIGIRAMTEFEDGYKTCCRIVAKGVTPRYLGMNEDLEKEKQ